MSSKKMKGQFYTTNSSYILEGFTLPLDTIQRIVEPFAGKGDLLQWIQSSGYTKTVDAYDIDPKHEKVLKQDTLTNPPDYKNSWVITNPPYLARNKSDKKDLYVMYNTNDLYKCFIHSLVQIGCTGGILIIPAGFFFSPRDIDVRCRSEFMKQYKITKVRYFEETVFDDTTTTIVALMFEKSDIVLETQDVLWELYPAKIHKTFQMSLANDWIIGGDIYNLPASNNLRVRRYVLGQTLKDGEQQTHLMLNALDSGSNDGRISLTYKKDYIYPAKECSRTYATLCISGKVLSEQQQIQLANEFNTFLEEKRSMYWSLFLPQYRESKEYARKRIPFELAYRIILHLLSRQTVF